MGRHSTGSVTTGEVLRIELSNLLKTGAIKKHCLCYRQMSWTNGSSIQIETSYKTDKGDYIRLIYRNTDHEGNKTDKDYKIYFMVVPSNLGKGEVLYFICPETHNRCRVLYCCYGSDIWKSRLAYRHRIYYNCQVSSKRSYWNSRYWDYENKIEKLEAENVKRRKQYSYKGKPTKFALKMEKLNMFRDHSDQNRWMPESFPLSLRKAIFKI